MNKKICIIGLGNMGSALATRLIENGCDIITYTRTKKDSLPLIATSNNLDAAILSAEVIIFTVFSYEQIIQYTELVSKNIFKQKIVLSITSTNKKQVESLSDLFTQSGATFLDIAMICHAEEVRQGKGFCVISGNKLAYNHAAPFLNLLCDRIEYTGTELDASNFEMAFGCILLLTTLGIALGLLTVNSNSMSAPQFLEIFKKAHFPVLWDMISNHISSALHEKAPITPIWEISNQSKTIDLIIEDLKEKHIDSRVLAYYKNTISPLIKNNLTYDFSIIAKLLKINKDTI